MVEPQPPQFGQVLRRLRVAAGLSQEALAERAGLSERGISDLERGRRRTPHPATIHKLAEALALERAARAELLQAARAVNAAPAAMPLRSTGRNALPLPPTTLIGRDDDMRFLSTLLNRSDVRLVTLSGAGGAGKTRLALEVAAQVASRGEREVIFVGLAPLSDADLVVPVIAETMGLRESSSGPLLETIAAWLRDRRVLLVLDNFEHVLGAAGAVGALLASCPGLQVLATSRAALRLRQEQLYSVAPLALPAPGALLTAQNLGEYGALALFVERANLLQTRPGLTSSSIATIASICTRLDGLPLAIELAAARLRVLSPDELLALLERRLPLLSGGARDLPVRHQTLRDTIAWSYDLLATDERALFRLLAVFSGGCTLSAIAHVTGNGSAGIDAVLLDRLAVLVDHNLLRRTERENELARFEMLETIREFGLEQLAETGEHAAVRERHAGWVQALVMRQGFDRLIPDEQVRLARIDAELDNVRSALRWYVDQHDAAGALNLCAALRQYWVVRGYLTEGRRWIVTALALDPDAPAQARARALYAGSSLACHQGDLDEVERMAGECLDLSRAHDDDFSIANGLHILALAAQLRGDYPRSEALYVESLAVKRRIHHPSTSSTLGNLAQVMFHLNEPARSIDLFNECITLDRATGDIAHLAVALTDLGLVMFELGDDARAEDLFREALAIHRDIGYVRMVIISLEALAALAAKRQRPERAALLYGAVDVIREQIGHPRMEPEPWQYVTYLRLTREQMAPAAFAAAWEAGRALPREDAIAEALAEAVVPRDAGGH